jgi:hypothetical protein
LAERERPRIEAEQKDAVHALERARAETPAAMQALGLERDRRPKRGIGG